MLLEENVTMRGSFQKIRNSASMVAPVASMVLPFVAPKLSEGIGKMQTAASAVGQIGNSVNNTADSVKNAVKNNQYHNKLNSLYTEKVASNEDEQDGKSEKKTKALAKIAPYAVGGTLLLAYGKQALKDNSYTKPIKDAVSGVPASVIDKIRKKSSAINGIIKGGKKGLKKANHITVVRPKQTPLGSFVNGVAYGAGILGAHMLGDALFKNKEVSKNYERVQPAQVKVVKAVKELKEVVDKNKKEKEGQEKTAAIKGTKVLKDISDKALDAGINLNGVLEYGIKQPVATAGAAFLGKELSSRLNNRVRRLAKSQYLKKLNKNKDNENKDNEKTAGVKDVAGKVGKFAKGYVRDYGQANLTSLVKPVAGAIATIPLVYGKEILDQRKITKKIKERQAEKENYEKGKEENGRDYKGGKRDDNIKHNI